MKGSVKERLILFIEHKQLSKNRFEELCGLSKRYVSNISQSIQPETIKKISLKFPELNMGWILTGEGQMLKQDEPEHREENASLFRELVDSLKAVIETQKQLIDAQNAEIERLQRAYIEKFSKEPK